MKRVEIERSAIAKAIDESPNITAAARNLGASRRTLQNRMRDYSMPEGEPGRPRQLLPYARDTHGDKVFTLIAAVALAGIVYAWWNSREKVGTSAFDQKSRDLRGLDVITY